MEVYGGERLVNTILIITPSDDDIHFSRLNLMYSLKKPEQPYNTNICISLVKAVQAFFNSWSDLHGRKDKNDFTYSILHF